MEQDKRTVRNAVLLRRDSLSAQERSRGKILLTERILGHQWFYLSEILLGFVSYGSEIDTGEILTEALRKGKEVYVPKVVRGEGVSAMRFYRITSMEELEEGFRGIREPSGATREYVYTAQNAARTLMLMPGAAFDPCRGRIGYGGGFYDRYLAGKPALCQRTIAVGFACQLVEKVPMGEHDIRPCQVICV